MNRPSLEELADSLCAAFPKLDDAQRPHTCATSPFRGRRRFLSRASMWSASRTCRRRVLSSLSARARTFRRPVSRDYRRGNRESRGACEHAADIKVGSLRRARVGRNGRNRSTGNRLVPFFKQRRLNHRAPANFAARARPYGQRARKALSEDAKIEIPPATRSMSSLLRLSERSAKSFPRPSPGGERLSLAQRSWDGLYASPVT
jgi:hypothetical protein